MAGPSYDQVNADYKAYLGRNASQDEYNTYWANVPDYNASYIANSAEGLAYTNKQVPGTPDYDPSAPVFSGNYTGQTQQAAPAAPAAGDNWDASRVNAYFASRGVAPFPTSADYWAGKWNEWGKNDPNYFMQRLSQADEFTGKGPNYDWQAAGQADPGTSAAGGAAGGGTGYRSDIGTSANSIASTMQSAQSNPYQDEIRKIVRERLKFLGQPVDENASGISDAVAGARDEGQRAAQNERTALAERLYAQNGGTGAGLNDQQLTQLIQQSGEKQAASVGGLRASLIMNEYRTRQAELQQLLGYAMSSGDADATRQIQMQLAALQAAIQQEGFGVDLAKFGAQLNQNAALAGLRG